MPLIGVVDPSHKEMARDNFGKLPNWLPLDEALEQAQEGGTKWSPWTYELIAAMFGEHQERQSRITASALVSHCTRADIIKRKMDYVEDLETLYIPFRGTMLHKVLEGYGHVEAMVEQRFYTKVGDHEISCSPDHLTRTTLSDYKVTENPPRYNYPWPNHVEQVQFNAYIVRHHTHREDPEAPFPFDPRVDVASKLVLVYLGPKQPKPLLVERTVTYESLVKGKKVKEKKPDVWSDERVRDILEPRVAWFQAGLDAFPEWPDGAEDVWGGPPGWQCPGYPLCRLPNCLAKRYPGRLVW